MRLSMLIKESLLSLRFNKVRVFLTMFGIIIGISSVVAILSIGAGLKAEVAKSSRETDVNTIKVEYIPASGGFNNSSEVPFTKSDMDQIRSISGVEKVEAADTGFSDFMGMAGEAKYFDKSTILRLEGYRGEGVNIIAGRGLTDEDNEFRNKVIVLTQYDAKDLFGGAPDDAVGKAIRIDSDLYQVVGVAGRQNSEYIQGPKNYVPRFVKEESQGDTIKALSVKVKDGYNLQDVFKNVKKELQGSHEDLEGKYRSADPAEIIKSFQTVINGVTGFIAVVSGISLFVAGIGVMNIMYVSVTERKREIGIRRAIGATPRQILSMFLIEAIIITGIGGLIGIILGFILSYTLGTFMPFKPVLTLGIILVAFLTSTLVGVVFGITPAIRASKMDPIKAIYR
ncbi:MAG: ABC transporter permease [Clostridium sp.]|uniref:ABC transporter permease n=1 Tax=Clostridium sp. TaxID=1506 RepID=UPI002FC69497